YRILPELRVSYRLAEWSRCREFGAVGLWLVVVTASQRLISYSDAIVLALFLPPAAIARFVVAANLNEYFASVFRTLPLSFYPALAQLDARGENDTVRRLYLAGSRFSSLITLVGGASMFVWAQDFLRLWIGD